MTNQRHKTILIDESYIATWLHDSFASVDESLKTKPAPGKGEAGGVVHNVWKKKASTC